MQRLFTCFLFSVLIGGLSHAQAPYRSFSNKEKSAQPAPSQESPVPVFQSQAPHLHMMLPPSDFVPIPGTPNERRSAGPLTQIANYDIIYHPQDGTPIWISGHRIESGAVPSSSEALVENALVLLESMSPILPLNDVRLSLQPGQASLDDLGIGHVQFFQIWGDIPVRSREIRVHTYPGGRIVVNGRMTPMAQLPSADPTIDAFSAGQLALTEVAHHHPVVALSPEHQAILQYEGPQTRLVWYPMPGVVREMRLAWEVTTRPNFVHRWEYLIDAHSGEILLEYDHTCSIGPTTANGTDLNGNNQTVNVFQAQNGVYYLLNAAKSMYKGPSSALPSAGDGFIFTGDWGNNNPSTANYSEITSNNNTWNSLGISAHHNASLSYDYFQSTFNHQSINAQGGDMLSFVNVADDDGTGLDNAFWNGVAIFYGNGKSAFRPLAASLDVAGHEMAHGVIQATANLEYQGESGALNESFADIFGVMIDRDNWLLGEDVVKPQFFPSGALRDMSDPHNGGSSLNDNGYQPRHTSEQYTGTQDNGGVHINSGIPNFAFYKFATATTKAKAEQVFFRALKQYLTRSSQFLDARLAVVQAATDLHGANSAEVAAVRTAFDQVGILNGQGGNYEPTVPTNPGQEFIVSTDINASDPTALYLSSTVGTNYQALSQTAHKRRISVTDDGEEAYFVGVNHNIFGIFVNPNATQETELTTNQYWDNIAVSKDGNRIAAVSRFIDTALWIYDFGLQQWSKYRLYNPTFATGISTGDVLYADAITWDHTGQYVLYDAFNRIGSQFGADIEYWDVGLIRVWNNSTNTFGDGLVTKLFSNLDQGISVGNAVFSTNSPTVIAFDYFDANSNETSVFAANIETGNVGLIFEQSILGVPAYSNQDDKLIFNAETSGGDEVIAVINLGPTKINPANGAQATVLIPDAKWGIWIAKGQRDINLSRADALAGIHILAYPNPMQDLLQVEISDLPAGGGTVKLFDLTGREMAHTAWANAQQGPGKWSFSTSGFPAGMYLLEINTLQGKKVLKVQK